MSTGRLKVVALTGAGISAESGLKTFRGNDGLWEGQRVEDVATAEAWERNPALVLQFYNERRRASIKARPNRGHEILAELEAIADIDIVTQNVDDLHERAGSTSILHLHGSLLESRSTADPTLIYRVETEALNIGDCCERGSQLRPNIVWFGEDVPLMEEAAWLATRADVMLVVGTSLQVYPAAGLVRFVKSGVPVLVVDPGAPGEGLIRGAQFIREPASTGMEKVREFLGSYLR
ncbi:MAG: Sir2 family NAD-dependent protein deacetylase [Bacteroidota bacterium]